MQRTISMLIAEDQHAIQDLLVEAAQESGFPVRISTTDNGRDCLTMLSGGNVDLAFIDIHMPELSGMEAVWVARKQGINTFVTIMTGMPSTEAIEAAAKLKAYEFLIKPFTVDDVIGIMQTYARVATPLKVLIVDDSPTTRQVVQKVVAGSRFTCEVVQAVDGQSAIDLCANNDFDAVLLDCNMPKFDGLATLRRLLPMRPGLKAVMISAAHDPVTERLALDCGARGFLRKPFYPEDIDRMLHAIYGLRPPKLNGRSREPTMLLSQGASGFWPAPAI